MKRVTTKSPNFASNNPIHIELYTAGTEHYHCHPDVLEFVCCLQGTVDVNDSFDCYRIHTGEVCAINCGDPHALTGIDDPLLASIYLDCRSELLQKETKDFLVMITPNREGASYEASCEDLSALLLSVLCCYEDQGALSQGLCCQLALKLEALMHERFGLFDYDEAQQGDEWSRNRFDKILHFINTHYKEKLTIKSISEAEHLNPNYLSTYFNYVFGDTFFNYLSVLRVSHSEEDLLNSDQTVPDIAFEYGFSDPKFYYRQFRKFFHKTPAEHRKAVDSHNEKARPNQYHQPGEISHRLYPLMASHFSRMGLARAGIDLDD